MLRQLVGVGRQLVVVLFEWPFLGREQGAPAIDVDAPPFQHHLAVAGPSPQQAQSEPFRNQLRHLVVPFPVAVFRPGVEAESGDRDLRAGALTPHEQGAEVAGPAAVRRDAEELDARGIHTDPLQHAPRPALVRGRIRSETYDLAGHELASDLAIYPR